MKLLVVIAAGLRMKDLALAPRISAMARDGFAVPLDTIFPAVTCSVQATWLTGKLPREHGVVGNGWYFRELSEIWLWRQSNKLVEGKKFYEIAAERDPKFTCAKLFWWFNMYAPVKWSVTPRPEYHADGLKKPALYTEPPELRARLQKRLGEFPLFQFWGPGAGLRSTRWIVDAAIDVLSEEEPALALVYLPHLDYDHQRFGPDDPRSVRAVGELDGEAGRLINRARGDGYGVLLLSEYGIEPVTAPVFPNRALHEAGFLRVHETSAGQLLDAGASRAFAVADHQCAHVYVASPDDIAPVKLLLGKLAGVERALDREEQREWGIDHARSGELVLVAAPGRWFAYNYWLDEKRRPDFATTIDIHRKPGYDPAELFIDPKLFFSAGKIGWTLLKKKLGFRYSLDIISTDPSMVRGSHGRIGGDPALGPVFISSIAAQTRDRVHSTEVAGMILNALEQ